MDIVLENISSLLVCTILFLIVYAALLNIYFICKNGFHISVNCWFCNKNSKVLYGNRNNFECPLCSQYNGFNKDGDYNKIIEAQYNTSLNSLNTLTKQKTGHSILTKANGLCNSCNRNQELKIIQLADYEALEERNYDKEIVHFEKQLEKSYGLCKTCSKTLKNTLRKQNAWIFGKRIKSLKNLSFLSKSSKATQGSQGTTRIRITGLILFALSLFNLGVELLPKNMSPKNLLPNDVILSDIYSSIYNFSLTTFGPKSFIVYLPKTIKLHSSSVLYITILGLSLELIFSFIESNGGLFAKLNRFISWLVLGLISSIPFKQEVSLYFQTLEIFCSLYLTYVYGAACIRPKSKFHLRRIKHEKTYSDDDESDSDSLNNSRASYRTALKRSPITANSFHQPTRNNTIINNDLPTARNLELNRHFNELNIGAFKDCQRPVSPNPFLNQSTRPQSSYNSPVNHYRSMFAPQSPGLNETSQFLSQTSRLSPMSVTMGPVRTQYNQPLFFPRDTSSVISQPISKSPPYNLRSSRHNVISAIPQELFRPLSPPVIPERPPRTLLSPSKLNYFHSDGKPNGSLSMSFHTDNVPHSGIWSTVPQRLVVNSLSNVSFTRENVDVGKSNNSRSSSTSSGFISNKGFSMSLPNSRDNSPERLSLFSEPVVLR